MRRDDANEMGLAVAIVLIAMLLADAIWLHVKCARQASDLAALSERLELHISPPQPPPEPSLADKAKQTYDKVKSAAVKGYQAAKEELDK
jgi:hypothetical protein